MLHYYAKKSFNEEPHRVDQPPTERAWIYGSEVTEIELNHIGEIYNLDKDILRDVMDKHELPRAEFSHGVLYIFARAPRRSARGKVVTTPFLAVIKGSIFITLASKKYIVPNDLFNYTAVDLHSAKNIFLQLTSFLVQQYADLVHETGKYVHNTEQRLRTHEVKNADFVKFVAVEGDLNLYKTNLSAMQAVLNRLRENRHDTFADKDCEYIEDVDLMLTQLLVSAESYRQTIDSIRNAYITIGNNILNQRMKTLTLLTLLVALPNVFYGMFGMNVALPFADEPWAYTAITLFTIVIVVIAYLFVRRARF